MQLWTPDSQPADGPQTRRIITITITIISNTNVIIVIVIIMISSSSSSSSSSGSSSSSSSSSMRRPRAPPQRGRGGPLPPPGPGFGRLGNKYCKILISQLWIWLFFTIFVKSLPDYRLLTWNLMQFIKCIKNWLQNPKLAKMGILCYY